MYLGRSVVQFHTFFFKSEDLRQGYVCVLVSQSCPTLCNPMNCSLLGSFVHGILQARILEGGCYFLLQGIFPTLGLTLGLLQCRLILYCLNY